MAIEYTQRWLKEANAKISNLGWFKPKTYEVLKTQKGLTIDEPVLAEMMFIVTPSNEVNTGDIVPIEVKFMPRVATETDYTITISDETLCTFNQENMTLEFKDKGGDVSIVVKATNGDAGGTKTITVNKPSTTCYVEQGNAIVKGIVKDLTFKLLPSDTTEAITNVEIFNNPEISIEPAEVSDSFKFKSDKLGDYYAKVTTNKQTYKVAIHVIEDESLLVTSISLDGIKPAYKYNEEIYINPSFEPETATNTVLNVVVEDTEIASYNPATKILKTGVKDGKTSVTINTVVGGNVKHDFEITVNEDGENPIPDITKIELRDVPETLEVNEKSQFSVYFEPVDANPESIILSTSNANISLEFLDDIHFVKGLKNGSSKVTAKSGTITDSKDVNVITKIDSLAFGTYNKNILSDSIKHDLPVNITPTTASNKTLEYTSTGVIKLDTSNKYYADAVGTGTVVVKSKDGSNKTITTETITVTAPIVKVSEIDIAGVPEVVNVGDTITFEVVVNPNNATDKTYTITNSNNISVNGNTFTANSASGNSSITATANDGSGVSKTITFNVVPLPVKVTTINVTGIPNEVEINKEGTFTIEVLPTDASDKTYTVTSSSNVTVTGNKFISNANGASSITVTANDGSGVKKVTNFTTVTKVTAINVTGVPSEITEGDVINDIVIEVLPADATDKTFTTSTSDEYNLTVSADGKTITGIGYGNGQITYTANDGSGVKRVVDIFVKNPPPPPPERFQIDGFKEEMTVNETNNVYVSLMPLSTEQVWSFVSSNPEVATVVKGEVTLDVTAIAVGTTTITLTADNDTSVKYEGTITVS